jgi:hypothetical protein
MTDLEKLIIKRTGLKQYKNYSPEDLAKLCQRDLDKEELKKSFIGFRDAEIDRAISVYYKYLDECSLESLAEKSSLISLVYMEILKERVQEFIRKEYDEKNGAIPLNMAEKVIELDAQIMEQKEKLGLLKDRDNASFLTTWEDLKKKTLKYYNEHAGETYVRCPNCDKLFRLLMKIDNLEPAKATFFSGTTLFNKPLFALYHEKRLTKDEMATIFGVHKKYIDFVYENLYLKTLKDKNEQV